MSLLKLRTPTLNMAPLNLNIDGLGAAGRGGGGWTASSPSSSCELSYMRITPGSATAQAPEAQDIQDLIPHENAFCNFIHSKLHKWRHCILSHHGSAGHIPMDNLEGK